jgi:hypothetical protein
VLSRGIGTLLALVAEQAATGEAAPSGDEAFGYVERLLDYLSAHPSLPMLIQRAAIDDSRQLRDTATRLLRPLYSQGVNLLAASGGRWEQADLPHVGAGLYHLIFAYFANAALIEAVAQVDPRSPASLARQRRFIKTAVSLLLGAPSGRATRRRRTP